MNHSTGINQAPYPATEAAIQVELRSRSGMLVRLTEWGAAIAAIVVPTPSNQRGINVTVGYDDPGAYVDNPFFNGSTIGRFAGRIDSGRCPIAGKQVQLAICPEQRDHCLHGGPNGLATKRWERTTENATDETSVTFSYRSTGGDQGFPGTLDTTVVYTLTDDSTLLIELTALCDIDTIVNLTNHTYFNLSGDGDIADHVVSINSDRYTPLDKRDIPTGKIRSVADSVYDLRAPTLLGERFDGQFARFDHYFVLNQASDDCLQIDGHRLGLAATAHCPSTQIGLRVYTTQPGLQFYTGQYLQAPFAPRQGMCFEAQGYPDAPNHSGFPSAALRAGQLYRQFIAYRFESLPRESMQ